MNSSGNGLKYRKNALGILERHKGGKCSREQVGFGAGRKSIKINGSTFIICPTNTYCTRCQALGLACRKALGDLFLLGCLPGGIIHKQPFSVSRKL